MSGWLDVDPYIFAPGEAVEVFLLDDEKRGLPAQAGVVVEDRGLLRVRVCIGSQVHDVAPGRVVSEGSRAHIRRNTT